MTVRHSMPFLIFCEEKFNMKKRYNLKLKICKELHVLLLIAFNILFDIETTNTQSKFYLNELEMFYLKVQIAVKLFNICNTGKLNY